MRSKAAIFNQSLTRLRVWLVGGVGIAVLIGLLWFNQQSRWIEHNGGLAAWLQALGSLYAIVAVSFPVFLQRNFARDDARRSVLTAAQLAIDLMNEVTSNAFDEDAHFSEWWVPQWHVIEEVCSGCPVHEIASPDGLVAFVGIRELFGRMRGWDEGGSDRDSSMESYVRVLCMNANDRMRALRQAFET